VLTQCLRLHNEGRVAGDVTKLCQVAICGPQRLTDYQPVDWLVVIEPRLPPGRQLYPGPQVHCALVTHRLSILGLCSAQHAAAHTWQAAAIRCRRMLRLWRCAGIAHSVDTVSVTSPCPKAMSATAAPCGPEPAFCLLGSLDGVPVTAARLATNSISPIATPPLPISTV
jgi:hypothetical protein